MSIRFHETIANETIAISVFDDSRIVGCAECSFCPGYTFWYFNRLFIRTEYRGLKLGSEVLDKMLHWIKKLQIPLLLEINPYGDLTYEQLEDFYIRHGFEKVNSHLYLFNKKYVKGELI